MASVTIPLAAAATNTEPRKRNRARLIEQTWIWSVVGYSLLRFFVAWGAFAEHGANIWIFGLIDVGTAWPYGKAVAEVCKRVARSEWARLPMPLAATVGMFFAPYAYLWFAAGEMPNGMRLGMVICVSVLFTAASAGVIANIRKLRREAREDVVVDVRTPADAVIKLAAVSADDDTIIELPTGAPHSELIIDLTGDAVSLERPTVNG